MTAESMISKRPVSRFTAVVFFLLDEDLTLLFAKNNRAYSKYLREPCKRVLDLGIIQRCTDTLGHFHPFIRCSRDVINDRKARVCLQIFVCCGVATIQITKYNAFARDGKHFFGT